MTSPLLTIQNIRVQYGCIDALKGISLDVFQGEIISLIGANGAGKSTTLRTVSGLHTPISGDILFQGHSIVHTQADQITRLGLIHAPEGRGIFLNLTVLENLEIGAYARRSSRREIFQDYEYIFSLFPRLKERRKQEAGTLSGGEQQMLSIGRALMGKPRVLLLDEPSLGLAPQVVNTIFSVIQKVNKEGTTVLLVEQNAYQALKISQRGYVLETGEIVLTGKSSELLTNKKIQEAYLGC
ncbi:MAG: ABC transporter ATP-binding protein [Gammaproteobacteria bacterium]|nr:ABC transporter ATP-binding protein [Gammaproteobacteria bacterium]